jgi:hypothetical protein
VITQKSVNRNIAKLVKINYMATDSFEKPQNKDIKICSNGGKKCMEKPREGRQTKENGYYFIIAWNISDKEINHFSTSLIF